ncbi:MAG: hypothetical protein NVSMB33_08530 [Ktedonobacteraceae bacterium]
MALLLLSGCTLFPAPAQSGTPATGSADNTTPTLGVSPTRKPAQGPTITFSTTGCPATPTINWDRVVATKAGVNKVQKVTCAPIENGALAALVNVRYYSSDSKLDVYAYDNLYATPVRRFSALGLVGGDAQVSPANTIMTAANPTHDLLGANVFAEYQWNGSTFAQILFPGMYPYVTHYQAEQAQATINSQSLQVTATPGAKFTAWQTSAYAVVNKLASDIFHWQGSLLQNTTLAYSNATQTYTVQATYLGQGGGGFVASLFRLDNVVTNLFEIKSITSVDGSLSLNTPANGTQLTSPVKVAGSYSSSGTIVGRVALLSDIFALLGDTGSIHGSATTGSVSFSPAVKYQLPVRGLEEGLVVFFVSNQNDINFANQVIVAKVFFSA